MKHLAILLLVFFIQGCGAKGPIYGEVQYQRDESKAEVYAYRLKRTVGALDCYEVKLDGEVTGELSNGGYLRREVMPGKHVVSFPVNSARRHFMEVGLEAEAGQTLYVEFNVELNYEQGIPESEIISSPSKYELYQGELMRFYYTVAQVKPDFALDRLPSLRDSSEVSCLATLRHEPVQRKPQIEDR
ncbi:hypothetical protein BTA51_09755 [Hahella sp. CCB-MM4]|uniref:DUF2846 domain-containing protein n=1 Tax=Hahella sp. (strain CCB-MM4) TaxID=1926491 RepID=UPI000B9A5CF9|nr:DUF2846 domain-containing protein [Hahella sp. CCB-MM4]OZG74046.1 hypothetical protein BTA51_09755 [Hahella sp. CCB-MM4]